jgi:hypothetical protein
VLDNNELHITEPDENQTAACSNPQDAAPRHISLAGEHSPAGVGFKVGGSSFDCMGVPQDSLPPINHLKNDTPAPIDPQNRGEPSAPVPDTAFRNSPRPSISKGVLNTDELHTSESDQHQGARPDPPEGFTRPQSSPNSDGSHFSPSGEATATGAKPRGRPFPKGNPAGPGRPKGRRNDASIVMQGMLAEHGPGALAKCLIRCREGDPVAMKLIIPLLPVRDRRIRIALPEIRTEEDIIPYLNAVNRALRLGQISPADSRVFVEMTDVFRAAFETRLMARALEDRKPDPIPEPPESSLPETPRAEEIDEE